MKIFVLDQRQFYLTADVSCPPALAQSELGDQATLIIDGQAMVIALGRPHGAVTFGDFADHFNKNVLQSGASYIKKIMFCLTDITMS